jgi:hypothetical protein
MIKKKQLTRTRSKRFREALKRSALTIGTCLALYAPAVDAAPKNGGTDAAEVDKMAGPTLKADETKRLVNGFADQVKSGNIDAALRMIKPKEKANYVSRQKNLASLVLKLLTNQRYKEEAKELAKFGIIVTPKLAQQLKDKFKSNYWKSKLVSYHLHLKVKDIIYRKTTPKRVKLTPPKKGIPVQYVKGPEVELLKIGANKFRYSLPMRPATPSLDTLRNLGPNAQAFMNLASEGLTLLDRWGSNTSGLKKDSNAFNLAVKIGTLLDDKNILRPQLKDDPNFKKLRDKLLGGDLSALKDMMDKNTDLAPAIRELLNNILTFDVLPYSFNMYIGQARVIFKIPSELRRFDSFFHTEGSKKFMKAALLGFFVDAAYSVQKLAIQATQTQLPKPGSGAVPKVIKTRMAGEAKGVSFGVGAVAGLAIGSLPMIITVQLAEFGYEDIKIPLTKDLFPAGTTQPTRKVGTTQWYIMGLSSIDILFTGKNKSAIKLISPRLTIKPRFLKKVSEPGAEISPKNWVFSAQAGYQIESGKNFFRFDVNPQAFILASQVKKVVDGAVKDVEQVSGGGGVGLKLNYVRRKLFAKGDVGVGVLTDYKYLGVKGSKGRHMFTVAVPLSWTRRFNKGKSLSFRVTPGLMKESGEITGDALKNLLAPENKLDKLVGSVMGQVVWEW